MLPIGCHVKERAAARSHRPFVEVCDVEVGSDGRHIHIKRAGRVRAIAVTMEKRAAVLPEVPAIAETVPGYSVSTWYGAMVPAKTSREIIVKLNQAMLQALALPDIKERLQSLGAEIVATSPEQTAQYFKAELEKYTKVAQVARIRGE